jgi:hypothetical protein
MYLKHAAPGVSMRVTRVSHLTFTWPQKTKMKFEWKDVAVER